MDCPNCGAPRESQTSAAIQVGRQQIAAEFVAIAVSCFAVHTAVDGWPRKIFVLPFGALALAAYAVRMKLNDLHLRDAEYTMSVGQSGVVYIPPHLVEDRSCGVAHWHAKPAHLRVYLRGGRFRFA